jgi:IclR family acetate operon transcriptional repressor
VEDGPTEGLSLHELSQQLGMSKSSTLATLRTLTSQGFLRESHPGPRYKLGMALIRLGDLTARQQLPTDLVRPILREIVEETGLTARLAIADHGFPVFVERVDGPGTIRFHTPLGSREPPHSTAAGKAILAELPPDEVLAVCRQIGLPARAARTITTIERLTKELAKIRRLGYAIDNEEDAEGVICVGAAYHNHTGTCAGAISVTGLKADFPPGTTHALGEKLHQYAAEVTSAIIGRTDGSPSPVRMSRQTQRT